MSFLLGTTLGTILNYKRDPTSIVKVPFIRLVLTDIGSDSPSRGFTMMYCRFCSNLVLGILGGLGMSEPTGTVVIHSTLINLLNLPSNYRDDRAISTVPKGPRTQKMGLWGPNTIHINHCILHPKALLFGSLDP